MERKLRLLVVFVVLLRTLVCFWAFSSEGLALLCFRDGVEGDPHGVLASWGSCDDPCSWFGVGCSDGKVVTLNLKSLSLRGKLTPMLGQLGHLKYLILSNNSFCGQIPSEIGRLKQLEVLDLGYNDFSGQLPPELQNMMILKYLITANNKFLDVETIQIHDKNTYDNIHQKEKKHDAAGEERKSGNLNSADLGAIGSFTNSGSGYITCNMDMKQMEATATKRRLLQENAAATPTRQRSNKANNASRQSPSPTPLIKVTGSRAPPPSGFISLPPSPSSEGSIPSPAPEPAETLDSPSPRLAPLHPVPNEVAPSPSVSSTTSSTSRHHYMVYISIGIGASVLVLFAIVFLSCQRNKVVTVRPWATGLSEQLQKAFVTGVPKLKRAELEAACEDFSNIIGTLPDGTLYKGTLSSGVEIAVLSNSVTNKKEWSRQLEAQFRNKIDTLSKVNHKNFVNLLGYCEEEVPFTRMMVFEYAPNGTLFEHLHVKESERLDWPARLRIAMGMAYCIEHLHQLNPPITHRSLNSAAIYLTDDFAAMISDFGLSNAEEAAVITGSGHSGLLAASFVNRENNVYDFGLVLLEILTGKRPHPIDERPLVSWAEDYLRGIQPPRLMIDPTLSSFSETEAAALCEVIKSCIYPDPKQRPTMKEVVAQLRQITSISLDGATPKLSPLWWAELEIISAEGS